MALLRQNDDSGEESLVTSGLSSPAEVTGSPTEMRQSSPPRRNGSGAATTRNWQRRRKSSAKATLGEEFGTGACEYG
jgi:hypothetical protein